MKKISKLLKTLPVLVLLTVLLSGCTDLLNWGKDFKQDFKGLDMVIQTYDNDSQLIDSIKGKSVKIEKIQLLIVKIQKEKQEKNRKYFLSQLVERI